MISRKGECARCRSDTSARWLRTLSAQSEGQIRLFCFHYAGGGASIFQRWRDALPAAIEPVAIQLPGREERFSEPAYDRMRPLIDQLVTILEPHLDRPFAYFGYSMGARVSFTLAQIMRERGLPTPRMLLVGGSPAPSLPIPVPGWNESEGDLAAYVRDLGGTPPDVLSQPDLLALLLPTVRADLTVVATWPYRTSLRLPCPIRAFAGQDDEYASPARMLAWRDETDASFELNVFPGGHFFIHDAHAQLLKVVGREVMSLVEE